MTLCLRLGDTSKAAEDPLETKEEPTPGLWWNQEQAGENAPWIILDLASSGFPGGLFNPWESGQARNWFQPGGEGEPTSIPEVCDNLNFSRLGNIDQPTYFSLCKCSKSILTTTRSDYKREQAGSPQLLLCPGFQPRCQEDLQSLWSAFANVFHFDDYQF